MRRGVSLLVATGATLVCSAALAPAAETPRLASAHGRALAVEVIVPGRGGARSTIVEAWSGRRHAVGPFWWPRDGALVSARSSEVTTRAAADQRRGAARATAVARDVALLGGRIRAARVVAEAIAGAARGAAATGGVRARVEGLRIDGEDVAASAGRVVTLAGLGTLTIGERVGVLRTARAERGFAVALHLRLHARYRGLPAGSEVLVGYADAGAAAPKPPPPRAPARGTPARSSTTPATAAPAAASAEAPAPSAASRSGDAYFVHGDPEAPPPGGFALDPPIDPARRAGLLGQGYAFPVVGGADFSNDFGAPRADTGFHQGIDLFAANGTPLVAVHDGTVFRVGWNRLGGNRLWLDDGVGNLFYYAHLSAYASTALEGARVRAGDVIGFVGNTGDAQGTPSHLHFEIHPGAGYAVPPFAYVTAWQRATPGTAPGTQLATPPAGVPSGPPQGLTPLDESDISSASGLDGAALERAAGGAEGASAQREPDDAALVDGATAPAFGGLTTP